MIIFVKRRGGVSQACDINRLHAVFIFSVQRGHTHNLVLVTLHFSKNIEFRKCF